MLLPLTIDPYLKTLAQGFLLFTHEYAVIILIAIGFLIFNRNLFGKALFILLFSMVINTYLKSIWKIPLPNHLEAGFSFPSGHMQTAFALWGWLAWEFKNRFFTGFVVFLLSGIAFGLIYLGYHTPRDILGALFFGSITLLLYYYFLKISWIQKHLPLIGLVFACLSVPFITLMHTYPSSIWVATGALIGFSLGWYYQDKYFTFQSYPTSPKPLKEKIFIVFIALSGVFVVKFGCQLLLVDVSKSLSLMLSSFLVGAWISVGVDGVMTKLINYIKSRLNLNDKL